MSTSPEVCALCEGAGKLPTLRPLGGLRTCRNCLGTGRVVKAKAGETVENPKTAQGLKKAPLRFIPPSAFIYEARVFELGAKKYSAYNWRESAVPASIYYEAALRHLMAWWDGQDLDEESGQPHLAHVRACMAILLDAKHLGRLEDDRPVPGPSATLLCELSGAPNE